MIQLSHPMKFATMLALAVILILAACGDAEDPAAASEPTTVAPTEAPAAPESPLPPESPLDAPIDDADGSSDAEDSDTEDSDTEDSDTEDSDTEDSDTESSEADTKEAVAVLAAPYSASPPAFETSQPEMGTVIGRLVSNTTEVPLNREIVRLAEVECPEGVAQSDKRSQCVWTLSNAFSPSTFTDENGFFAFTDVPPQDYVIIAGDMIGKYINIADENGPFMLEAISDEITDTGEHHIEW